MNASKLLKEVKETIKKVEYEEGCISSDIHCLTLEQIDIENKISELIETKKNITKRLQKYKEEVEKLEKIIANNKPLVGQLDVFGGEVGETIYL